MHLTTFVLLVADRARETCKHIQAAFYEMHEKLQDQPKDIEKLTEMTEFLASLSARSAELQEAIDEMVAMHPNPNPNPNPSPNPNPNPNP